MSGYLQPGSFEVFADRTYRFNYPLDMLFLALTSQRDRWLVLVPGEVRPEIVEAVAGNHVVWSSFWPVSPHDRIEMDLVPAEPGHRLLSCVDRTIGPQSTLRFQWLTNAPPDGRGIAITRQRLNRKLGGDLRAMTSDYYWKGRIQEEAT